MVEKILNSEARLIENQSLVDDLADKWLKIFNELTYAGFKKQKIYEGLDRKFGEENWFPAHFFEGKVVSRLEGYLIYEESYYQFLKDTPEIREWIINTASEVYDIQPSNVECGMDYSNQECGATHLQDISVRRSLTRLKLEEEGKDYAPENLPVIPIFKGDHLVQIRGHTTEGYCLNPGKVPFHKPEAILDTEQKGWWDNESVEGWYQKNKVLLVDPDNMNLRLVIAGSSDVFFELSRQEYYSAEYSGKSLSKSLWLKKGKDARRLLSVKDDNHYIDVKDSPRMSFAQWQETMQNLELPYSGSKLRINFGCLHNG
jgi:hypothetical protein